MGPETPPPGGGDGSGPAAGAWERLRVLGPQWAGASGSAFAGMAQAPARYAAASRLVAAWLERLRSGGAGGAGGSGGFFGAVEVDGVDEEGEAVAAGLLAAWDGRGSGTGDAAVDGAALPLTAAEREALTAAAFAIRYGEVVAWVAARRRRRTMTRAARDAREAGRAADWLVLDEVGDPAGDPFVAYRRLEVDPVTGAGVLIETRPDDSFTGVVHTVHAISVDPASGELSTDNSAGYWEFDSAAAREGHVAALRAGGGG